VTLRTPDFLGNRITDGGEDVDLMHQPSWWRLQKRPLLGGSQERFFHGHSHCICNREPCSKRALLCGKQHVSYCVDQGLSDKAMCMKCRHILHHCLCTAWRSAALVGWSQQTAVSQTGSSYSIKDRALGKGSSENGVAAF
jgi:hypothetical protein